MTKTQDRPAGERPYSSVRATRSPLIPRRVWLIGSDPERLGRAAEVFRQFGHEFRAAETSTELALQLRDFRPHLIIVDLQERPERGRQILGQLRADRATRQVPVVLVGLSDPVEIERVDRATSGPTRRYALSLDAESVRNALLAELD